MNQMEDASLKMRHLSWRLVKKAVRRTSAAVLCERESSCDIDLPERIVKQIRGAALFENRAKLALQPRFGAMGDFVTELTRNVNLSDSKFRLLTVFISKKKYYICLGKGSIVEPCKLLKIKYFLGYMAMVGVGLSPQAILRMN